MTVPAMIATNAIPRYLESIQRIGIPSKVDGNHLKSIGFKNSNDAALVPLFKSLGFLDSGGKPTDIYHQYRAADPSEGKRILGTAVKSCYADLFSLYPDAHRKDDEALTNWIRANTDKGQATQARALSTFKTLRSIASFDEAGPPQAILSTSNSDTAKESDNPPIAMPHIKGHRDPDVTINITLQIAPTDDASIYDKFFASMKRHLFTDES